MHIHYTERLRYRCLTRENEWEGGDTLQSRRKAHANKNGDNRVSRRAEGVNCNELKEKKKPENLEKECISSSTSFIMYIRHLALWFLFTVTSSYMLYLVLCR